MKSLANREFDIEGNWHQPLRHFKSYSSVILSGMYDETSSAGDWSGFFVQKMGKNSYHVIYFNQENNGFGSYGFTVTTTLIGESNTKPSLSEIYEFINLSMIF